MEITLQIILFIIFIYQLKLLYNTLYRGVELERKLKLPINEDILKEIDILEKASYKSRIGIRLQSQIRFFYIVKIQDETKWWFVLYFPINYKIEEILLKNNIPFNKIDKVKLEGKLFRKFKAIDFETNSDCVKKFLLAYILENSGKSKKVFLEFQRTKVSIEDGINS